MKEVHIWQAGAGWKRCLKGTTQVVAGLTSYEDAVASALDAHGPHNVLAWAPPEISLRSVETLSDVARSTMDRVCDTAPLQSDCSTIPAVYRILNVELDLLPLLKDAVEQAGRRLDQAIRNNYGTESLPEDEVQAMKIYRQSRLDRVNELLAQIAA